MSEITLHEVHEWLRGLDGEDGEALRSHRTDRSGRAIALAFLGQRRKLRGIVAQTLVASLRHGALAPGIKD